MHRPAILCPLCGRNTRFWSPGSNQKWECNEIGLSWPGVIDADRDMSNDGTLHLLLSPERQPTFTVHRHCLWVLCRDGAVSYMDAYRLCRSLQQERSNELCIDSVIDPLHLFDSPDPFDARNYGITLDCEAYGIVLSSYKTLEKPRLPLEQLPLEILYNVFEYLPLYSLMACSFLSSYIEAAVGYFCTSDPLIKLAITRFADGLLATPDSWELLRRQFSSGQDQTINMIDNFWQLLDNTRSLHRIKITERTPYDAELHLLDLEQPITFFSQRVRQRRYVCGFRLNGGTVFGIETKAVHRTTVAVSDENPLRLFVDGLGIHGVGIGPYLWKDSSVRCSWMYYWSLETERSASCVFDGCKLRVRSVSSDSPIGTPEPTRSAATI